MIEEDSTSHFYISHDYGSSFEDISFKFALADNTTATVNKFFHHPQDNCYYVFTDLKNNQIFVTRDCLETVDSYSLDFNPSHVEFDKKHLQRFLVHDREDEQRKLYVTSNFGQTFFKASDYVKSFFWHEEDDSTELYISRMEPHEKLSVLSSTSFFEDPLHTSLVVTGVTEFEKKGNFLFVVRDNKEKVGEKRLLLAKVGQRFVEALFPTEEPLKDFHVCEVTEDDQILVIVNHAGNKSNLYTSDRINPHQAEFSLSLERIFYYSPDLTWRNSWLDKINTGAGRDDNNFADFYKIAGLRGVYIASQLAEGMTEEKILPNNITTLITFDGGAEWSKIEGPRTDSRGYSIPGCYQVSPLGNSRILMTVLKNNVSHELISFSETIFGVTTTMIFLTDTFLGKILFPSHCPDVVSEVPEHQIHPHRVLGLLSRHHPRIRQRGQDSPAQDQRLPLRGRGDQLAPGPGGQLLLQPRGPRRDHCGRQVLQD